MNLKQSNEKIILPKILIREAATSPLKFDRDFTPSPKLRMVDKSPSPRKKHMLIDSGPQTIIDDIIAKGT
jgi:hypothetical protein